MVLEEIMIKNRKLWTYCVICSCWAQESVVDLHGRRQELVEHGLLFAANALPHLAGTAAEEASKSEVVGLLSERWLLFDLLEPPPWNVFPEFYFISLLTRSEDDHFLDIV